MQKIDLNELLMSLQELYDVEEIRAIYRALKEEPKLPDNWLNRLQQYEPVQYVMGYTWFYKRKYRITKDTLIPRPETEELCEIIIKENDYFNPKIMDIGTGSGCIAITLALEIRDSQVYALDISPMALEVAKHNAHEHNTTGSVHFIESDFLIDKFLGNDYQIIVSNPPYIDRKELDNMSPNVTRYEPYMALFPAGHDPLVFYKKLNKMLHFQQGDCTLYAEINPLLAIETLDCFSADFERIVYKDMSQKQRFIRIKKGG